MPIKPENRHRYPADWKTVVRPAILKRAGHRCEGSPDYPNCRAEQYRDHPMTGSKVVLTIAHVDQNPENNDPENLRAWCQRCHLNHDRKARAAALRLAMSAGTTTDINFGFRGMVVDGRIDAARGKG